MSEYKDIDSMIKIKEERRSRVKKELLEHQKQTAEGNDDQCTDAEKLDCSYFEITFCLDKFLTDHPNVTYKGFTNFTNEGMEKQKEDEKLQIYFILCRSFTHNHECVQWSLDIQDRILSQKFIPKQTNQIPKD